MIELSRGAQTLLAAQRIQFAIIGQRIGHGPAAADDKPRPARPRQQFRPRAPAEQDEVCVSSLPQQAGGVGLHDAGGRGRYRQRPTTQGAIELRDTDRLRENLDRIEVAVGVERIAGVIASDGDGDARGRKFVQ